MNKTNKQNRTRDMETGNRLTAARGKRVGGMVERRVRD